MWQRPCKAGRARRAPEKQPNELWPKQAKKVQVFPGERVSGIAWAYPLIVRRLPSDGLPAVLWELTASGSVQIHFAHYDL